MWSVTFRCCVPGLHNVYNALAAIAVGFELDVPFQQIAEALASFTGAGRRFQFKGEAGGVMVVDDYGHHPTEVKATWRLQKSVRAADESWCCFNRIATAARTI